jgi:hypothetical protein
MTHRGVLTSTYTHIQVRLKIYLISIKLYYILYIYIFNTPNTLITPNTVEFDYSSYNSF